MAGDLDQVAVGLDLVGDAVVLQLDVEVVGAEDVLEAAGGPGGGLDVVPEEGLAHHAAQAAGGGDDALFVALEQLPVTAGLYVVARQVGLGGQLDDVLVAGRALGQQGQVVVELLAPLAFAAAVVHATPPGRALEPALRRHVGLDAQHRDDAGLAGRLVEGKDAVHVPVVGDPDGGLAVGHRGGDDIVDPGRPVEHRVLGVDMEMGEAVSHPRLPFVCGFSARCRQRSALLQRVCGQVTGMSF